MSEGKSVLITGCSAGGIGEALSLALHQRKLKVIATARDISKAKALEDIGITVLELDVCKPASIQDAVGAVKKLTNGTLDILINNAGIGYAMPILDADLETSRNVFETNLFGRMAVTKAFSPFLIRSKGTIVNIGSISGICPTPFSGVYNACCAAVHQWNDTLRLEMKPFDVRVTLIITGAIQSNFLSNLPVKLLPSESLYSPKAAKIEAGMNGKNAGSHTDIQVYAERVASRILRSSPPKHYWSGVLTTRLWLVSTLLWATAWDLILEGPFGLKDLRDYVKRNGSV